MKNDLKDKRFWLFLGFVITMLLIGMGIGAEFATRGSEAKVIAVIMTVMLVGIFSISYLLFFEWLMSSPQDETKDTLK